jgi:hypothetical protein
LAESVWVSTQSVPPSAWGQLVLGAAQPAVQTPAVQEFPAMQGVPQAPQCAESAEISVSQIPPSPQVVKPGRQAQAPAAQSLLGKQLLPQPPQFEGSVFESTHAPSQ